MKILKLFSFFVGGLQKHSSATGVFSTSSAWVSVDLLGKAQIVAALAAASVSLMTAVIIFPVFLQRIKEVRFQLKVFKRGEDNGESSE